MNEELQAKFLALLQSAGGKGEAMFNAMMTDTSNYYMYLGCILLFVAAIFMAGGAYLTFKVSPKCRADSESKVTSLLFGGILMCLVSPLVIAAAIEKFLISASPLITVLG